MPASALMSFTRLPFVSLDWAPGTHPLERKKLVDGRPIAVLEFAPGFEDPKWCDRGHVIYVISGTLELALESRTECLEAGEACVLDRNTRHRARNPGALPVRLFVVTAE